MKQYETKEANNTMFFFSPPFLSPPASTFFQMSPVNGLNATKTNSAPTLRTKLDPLPGSPLHDETLNPAKPLPPAPIQAFAATNPILGEKTLTMVHQKYRRILIGYLKIS